MSLFKKIIASALLIVLYSANVAATEQQDLTKLLAEYPDNQTLILNLENEKTDAGLIQAWQAIVQALNKTYYVARNDLSGFQKIQKVIKPLENITETVVSQLNGKLKNNPELAAEIMQLHFRVANYYSIANDFNQAQKWLDRAGKFMNENNLQISKEAAVYHNLRGGELSRQYQAGKLKEYPAASIKEFEEALVIHKKLGNTLKDNTHMRHIQMCLASVIMQDAIWQTLQNDKITKQVRAEMDRTNKLLNELEPTLGDDGYRIAGTLQIRSYVSTLQGNFDQSLTYISQAQTAMPQKDTGQLSNLLNEYANICVAKAAANLLESNKLTAGKAENMYAEQAQRSMQEISTHPYAKLARIVLQK